MKNGLKALYGSKLGKVLPVLVIAGLVATASATVFINYYAQGTATVASSGDVHLVAGADASSSSTYAPTVSVASTYDFASLGITLLPSATQSAAVQPNIYYTDLLDVTNTAATASHSINSISISNIVDAGSSLGEIDVYYCITQTNAPTSGANCELYSIISTTSPSGTGSVSFPVTLAAGATNYIEVVAHAAATATGASTVTFDLQISWV